MSIIGKCLSAVFLYAICSVSSFANETGNTTNNSTEPEAAAAIPKKPGPSFYGGLKVGAYATNVPDIKFGIPGGIVLGFGTPKSGLELEVNAARLRSLDADTRIINSRYASAAIYYAARTSASFYFKYRIGLATQFINSDIHGSTSTETINSDVGFSGSIGGGKRFSNNLLFDAEYTFIDQDLSAFTVGLNLLF